MTYDQQRSRAAEAARLANELANDLRAGVCAYSFFQQEASNEFLKRTSFIALTRLCLFHIVSSLAKFVEFYEHYRAVLPPGLRHTCLSIYRDIKSRGVVTFRNKIVGHLWDSARRRPIPTAEVMDSFGQVCRGTWPSFLAWIHSQQSGTSVSLTVVGVLDDVHRQLHRDFAFTRDEMRDHEFQFPR